MKNLLKAGALAAVALFAVLTIQHDDDPVPVSNNHGAEWSACKSAVRDHLSNPDSADFELTSTHFRETGFGMKISGNVKADNAFGATREIPYSCSIDASGHATASVTE